MQLHQLIKRKNSKEKKRVGRGGKRGTYSGKGQKGQKSRAGHKMEPAIRQFIKKYPKLRGYRFNGNKGNLAVVNLADIENKFKKDEVVSPSSLLEKKLIRRIKGRIPQVKILAGGEMKSKFNFENCAFSKTAEEKIKKTKAEK